jgi:hypothetical protein
MRQLFKMVLLFAYTHVCVIRKAVSRTLIKRHLFQQGICQGHVSHSYASVTFPNKD